MSGIPANSILKTCFFWNKNGECKHGEACHFLHRKTGIIADPPKSWVDYGDKGPPKKAKTYASTKGSVRDDSETEGGWPAAPVETVSDWEPSSAAKNKRRQGPMEDEWEKAIPSASDDWDQQPPPATKPEGRRGRADPSLVDNWFPPSPKANGSVAASNTPNRYVAAAATPGRYPDSVAASNTPNRYASSAAASNAPGHDQDSATASSVPATSAAHDSSPAAVGDIWDALLPPEFAEYTTIKRKYGTSDSEFEIDSLVVLLSAAPFRLLDVERYLDTYTEQEVRRAINVASSKITSLFFAVATNEPKALKLLIEKGGDVNATAGIDGIPVLAFAIMHGSREDTTEMVRILLAHGADSTVIPDEFMSSDNHFPKSAARTAATALGATQWCSEKYWAKLANTINISQQYWLAKSRQQRPRTARELMVARKENCQKLFQIPYSLIGQEFATGLLTKRVLSHVLLSGSGTKPLVVVFAGASGHGKTELAKCVGALLSVESLVVDSTEMNHITDLFGPKAPFPGYEDGSALNNFLCRNHGQRSVVFLDNFKAMGSNVFDLLLIPFGEGKYRDRRTARTDAEIDCSKVIWILATSEVDNIIEPYYRAHIEALQSPAQDHQVVASLVQDIEAKFLKKFSLEFGTPFAGRISLVLPFFPFSPTEQAVVAHKYILELKRALAADIDVSNDAFMGHIKLDVEGEPAVCRLVARNGYSAEYGARSIAHEVEKIVRDAVTQEWLRSPEDIMDQNNAGPYERYCLAVHASGGYVHVRKANVAGRKQRAKANAAGKQNGGAGGGGGGGGVRLGTSSAGRSTPVAGGRPKPPKVGRLIDIGGEIMKGGWEE